MYISFYTLYRDWYTLTYQLIRGHINFRLGLSRRRQLLCCCNTFDVEMLHCGSATALGAAEWQRPLRVPWVAVEAL